MYRDFSAHRGELLREIIARVAAGETLKAICADPRLPSADRVRKWKRTDAALAEALDRALRHRNGIARGAYCPAQAQAILRRLAAGETIPQIVRDAAMPSRRTLGHWRATHSAFGAEVLRLLQVRRTLRGRARTIASHRPYDEAVANRIQLRLVRGEGLEAILSHDPDMPSRKQFARWRRESRRYDYGIRVAMHYGFKYGRLMRMGCTPEVIEAIVDRIIEGASLNSLGAWPDMPTRATLYRWHRRRQDFRMAVDRACIDREDVYLDRIHEIAMQVTPGTVTATLRRMGPLKRQLVRLRKRPGYWKNHLNRHRIGKRPSQPGPPQPKPSPQHKHPYWRPN